MKTINRLLVIVATLGMLAVMTGCKTPVQTQAKPGASFDAYHSFALLPMSQVGPTSDPGAMLRLAQPAQDAASAALTAKGFTPAPRETADFAVNLRGQSLPKVEVTDWGYNRPTWTRPYGYMNVHVGQVDVRTYQEKTLFIEIFDNKSHDLAWVGWMTKDTNARISVEQIKEAVAAILEKFPPPPGSNQ